MVKIVTLLGICLLVVGVVGLCDHYYNDSEDYNYEEPEDTKAYEEKEIVYAPIECFLNETYYDTKCVEDYLNG